MAVPLANQPRVTAEWQCTKCDATNRKYVPVGTEVTLDRCVACHTRHTVWPASRPVRWNAEVTEKR
jgi:hypothetical protein